MKKLEFLLCVIFLIVLGCASEPKMPTLKLLNNNIDLGTVASNTKKEFKIFLMNDGDGELKIINVQPSCKCMVGDNQKLIAPHTKDSIVVVLKASQPGSSEETIVIVSNTKEKFDVVKVKSIVK